MAPEESEQRHLIRQAFARTGLSVRDLRLRHLALTGNAAPADIGSYLDGTDALDAPRVDVPIHALNERFGELGQPRTRFQRRGLKRHESRIGSRRGRSTRGAMPASRPRGRQGVSGVTAQTEEQAG